MKYLPITICRFNMLISVFSPQTTNLFIISIFFFAFIGIILFQAWKAFVNCSVELVYFIGRGGFYRSRGFSHLVPTSCPGYDVFPDCCLLFPYEIRVSKYPYQLLALHFFGQLLDHIKKRKMNLCYCP